MRIPGLTWDKFTDVVKGTWHIVGLLCILIWYVASYKAGIDYHFSVLDQQMKIEDNKLNWLINHHSDKDNFPPADQQFVPQAEKVKPQSYLGHWPRLEAERVPQDAQIPNMR